MPSTEIQRESTDDTARKFLHTCKNCQARYRIVIRVDLYTIHRAVCPQCEKIHYFDNRDGRLNRTPFARPTITSPPGTSDEMRSTSGVGTPPEPEEQRTDTAAFPDNSPGDRAAGVALKEGPPPAEERKKPETDYETRIREARRKLYRPSWRDRLGLPSLPLPSWLPSLPSLPSIPLLPFDRDWKTIAIIAAVIMFALPPFIFISLNFPNLYLPRTPGFYLGRIKNIEANRILDRNGKLLAELISEKTGNLQADEIPEGVKRKLIFIEDENFYNHSGVDWMSVLRAFAVNFMAVGVRQGGSGLTQQLARILLNDRSRRIIRKLRETALAYYLEDHLTKDQILTAYINHVYLGHGAVGMDTASRFYYDKPLNELNFTEELVLTSLPSAPEHYSPLRNPHLLEKKINAIYKRMKRESFPAPEPQEFEKQKIALFRGMNRSPSESVFGNRANDAPYVAEYVRQHIRKVLGPEFEFSAGLSVETTIDETLQRAAASESRLHIQEISAWIRPVIMRDGQIIYRHSMESKISAAYSESALGGLFFGLPVPAGAPIVLQTASIGVEPASGEVLFMQGGTEFKPGNQLNRAIDMRRQTGSAIKPIVYSAAIESGKLTAASRLDDRPLYRRRVQRKRGDPEFWLPGNISGVYEGSISVRRAFAFSKNIPAIRVAQIIGMPRLSEQFRKFFFSGEREFQRRFRMDQTVAIGSLEMSPLEMATAYSVFGNNGVIRRPYLIRMIRDREGRVLYRGYHKDEFNMYMESRRQIISGDTAQVMYSMMSDSGRNGGVYSGGMRDSRFIGKTGTTNDFRDAWFVGVTPGLSAAVWVGYDDPYYSMYRATGSVAAGPLWGRIVSRGMNIKGGFHFSPQAVGKEVCADSGLLPRRGCRRIIKELFVRNHIPEEQCDLHTDSPPVEIPRHGDTIQKTDFD